MTHRLDTGKARRHFVNRHQLRWYRAPLRRSLCSLFKRGAFGASRPFDRVALIPRENLFEALRNVRVERIRPIGILWLIAPMFVHPEPWGGISTHIRLKGVPAGLRNLLMRHPGIVVDLWLED